MLIETRPQYCQFVHTVCSTCLVSSLWANSSRNTFQQFILFLLIMMGSAIFVSSAIIHIRKRAFEKKLEELAARKRRIRPGRALTFSLPRRRGSNSNTRTDAIASGAVRGTAIKEIHQDTSPESTELKDQDNLPDFDRRSIGRGPPKIDTAFASTVSRSDSASGRERRAEPANGYSEDANRPNEHIRFGADERSPQDLKSPTHPERRMSDKVRPLKRTHTRLFDGSGVGARSLDQHPRNARPFQTVSEAPTMNDSAIDEELDLKRTSGSLAGIDKYLKTIDGYIGRNSQFHNLTERERRKLGGIEYDAICLLSYVVPIYFVLWQLLGALGVGAWFSTNLPNVALQNGLESPRRLYRQFAYLESRPEPLLDRRFLRDKCLQQFWYGFVGCQRGCDPGQLLSSSHLVAPDPGRQHVFSAVPPPHSLDYEESSAEIV